MLPISPVSYRAHQVEKNDSLTSVHYVYVLDEASCEEVPLTVLGVRTYHGQQQINIMLQNGLTVCSLALH